MFLLAIVSAVTAQPPIPLPGIPAGLIKALIDWVVRIVSGGVLLFLVWDLATELMGRKDVKKISLEIAGSLLGLAFLAKGLEIINALLTFFGLPVIG